MLHHRLITFLPAVASGPVTAMFTEGITLELAGKTEVAVLTAVRAGILRQTYPPQTLLLPLAQALICSHINFGVTEMCGY